MGGPKENMSVMNDVFTYGCVLMGGIKQSVYNVVSKIYGWHEGVNILKELMKVLMNQMLSHKTD